MKVLAISALTTLALVASFAVNIAAADKLQAGNTMQATQGTPAPAQEVDPVCGMSVDAAKAKAAGRMSQHEGKTYYFCNDSCKKQFDADPTKFAAQAKSSEQTSEMNGCCRCCGGNGAMGGNAGGGMCCRRMH